LNNIEPSLLFDVSKTFASQKKRINKKLLPAIKAAINPSMNAYDTEIVNIVRQLHKPHRELWRINNEGRVEEHNKRQHMASRREQV
jgi:hypothetical protein